MKWYRKTMKLICIFQTNLCNSVIYWELMVTIDQVTSRNWYWWYWLFCLDSIIGCLQAGERTSDYYIMYACMLIVDKALKSYYLRKTLIDGRLYFLSCLCVYMVFYASRNLKIHENRMTTYRPRTIWLTFWMSIDKGQGHKKTSKLSTCFRRFLPKV